MAHRLISGMSEKCSVPHGHNEYVRVFLEVQDRGKTSKRLDGHHNMVVLFEKVKARWHAFIDGTVDHAFQLASEDPLIGFFRKYEPQKIPRLLVTPGDPTTELLCACLMSKLQAFLDTGELSLGCVQIEVEETPTNTVVLKGYRAYEKVLPISKQNKSLWWERADDSINDITVLV